MRTVQGSAYKFKPREKEKALPGWKLCDSVRRVRTKNNSTFVGWKEFFGKFYYSLAYIYFLYRILLESIQHCSLSETENRTKQTTSADQLDNSPTAILCMTPKNHCAVSFRHWDTSFLSRSITWSDAECCVRRSACCVTDKMIGSSVPWGGTSLYSDQQHPDSGAGRCPCCCAAHMWVTGLRWWRGGE